MTEITPESLGKCANCPHVRTLLGMITADESRKEMTTSVAVSEIPEFFAEKLVESGALEGAFAEMLGDEIDISNPESVVAALRRGSAVTLDGIDEKIGRSERTIQDLVADCESPLTMRASKAGVQYMATICTSRALHLGLHLSEPVRITRSPANPS